MRFGKAFIADVIGTFALIFIGVGAMIFLAVISLAVIFLAPSNDMIA